MFGDKTKLIQELNEFTAVNTFCFLLLQIDSEDKTQRKSMNLPFNPPSSNTPKEEWLNDGWPENQLCEVNI